MNTVNLLRILVICSVALIACTLLGCRTYPPTVGGHVSRYGAANVPTKPAKLNRRF